MILPRKFYLQPTKVVAKKLLGCYLISEHKGGRVVGRIVETEAYLKTDPASHGFKGPTPRNKTMFGKAGCLYVYFIYGMYYCLNIVTGPENIGEAVLIRAIEPVFGVELMEKRRNTTILKNLTNGPARLAQAFGIDLTLNGVSLNKKPIFVVSDSHFGNPADFEVVTTPRIGINKAVDLPLRFYIQGNQFVSRGG